jgi:hypothetical protein
MVAALPRGAAARKQLQAPGASNELLRACVRAAQAAAAERGRVAASPAGRLLASPWGLPVLERAGDASVLLCGRTLLAAVRLWKATHAGAAAAGVGGGGGGNGNGGATPAARPALLMRMGSSASRGSASPAAARMATAAAAATQGGGDDGAPEVVAVEAACAVAGLLSDWLRARAAEVAPPDGPPGAGEEWGEGRGPAGRAGGEVTQCLCACLLLLLQEVPEAAGAIEEEDGQAGPAGPAGARPQLQLALLDVLPGLCSAAAAAAAAAAPGGGDADSGSDAGAISGGGGGAHRAAVLQLLIEVLQRQLAPPQWLPLVGAHLALVPMLERACGGDGGGEGSSGGADAEAGAVRVSALELLLAVASVPEGALQLFQQGALPAVLGAARRLLAPGGGGLLAPDGGGGGGDVAMARAGPGSGGGGGGGGSSGAGPLVPGTLGAYRYASPAGASGPGGGGAAWAPPHQQWCVLLSVAEAALRHLSRCVPVAEPAVAFVVAIEPRAALALQALLQQLPAPRGSGGGGGEQGAGQLAVQLACLLEAERVLAVLCLLAQHTGAWQVARPGAVAAFRAAAAGVLEFAARPSMER